MHAIVPMDVSQHLGVQVRAEHREKSGSDIQASETEVNPLVRYDRLWRGGQDRLVALYQPRFMYTTTSDRVLPDPNLVNYQSLNLADPNDTPTSALHNGGAGLELVRKRWRLSLYQFLAYGPITTTALLVQPAWNGGWPNDPAPIVPSTIGARFRLAFIQTQLFLPIRLTARTAVIPGLSYNAFGGADRASRGVVALTQGPGASVALEHALTRNDRLTTTLGVGQVLTSFRDRREAVAVLRSEATQSWRHTLSRTLVSEAIVGGSIGGDSINGYTLFSVAQAALLWDSWGHPNIAPGAPPYAIVDGRGDRVELSVAAKVQPWIDLFSGGLEQRGVISWAGRFTHGRFVLRFGGGYAEVLPSEDSVAEYRILSADGSLQYRVTQSWSVEAGGRFGDQSFNNAVRFSDLTQSQVFAGVMFAPLPARL